MAYDGAPLMYGTPTTKGFKFSIRGDLVPNIYDSIGNVVPLTYSTNPLALWAGIFEEYLIPELRIDFDIATTT